MFTEPDRLAAPGVVIQFLTLGANAAPVQRRTLASTPYRAKPPASQTGPSAVNHSPGGEQVTGIKPQAHAGPGTLKEYHEGVTLNLVDWTQRCVSRSFESLGPALYSTGANFRYPTGSHVRRSCADWCPHLSGA